jgi:hypothetical protein
MRCDRSTTASSSWCTATRTQATCCECSNSDQAVRPATAFVDPDGFVADRAYDLGVAIRDWSSRLNHGTPGATLQGYCRLLAEHTSVDVERIWKWGFVERVSTGLYVLSLGAEAVALPFLQTAELLV